MKGSCNLYPTSTDHPANDRDGYCERHTSLPSGSLNDVYRSVALHTANPNMASPPYQGAILKMLAAVLKPTVTVEIGSHAGFGASCIATGMGGHGILHLVEANDEYEPLIRRHASMAHIEDTINLHIGKAVDIIPNLPDNIDFAYIDADKENYPLYYQQLVPKMRHGGLLLLDNMLWYGRVVEYDQCNCTGAATESQLRCERETRILHSLNDAITTDPRVENILLPLGDGLMLCRVL